MTEIGEEQNRCQDERYDPGDDCTPGRTEHSLWQHFFHVSSPLVRRVVHEHESGDAPVAVYLSVADPGVKSSGL